jgi:hypothetical protein
MNSLESIVFNTILYIILIYYVLLFMNKSYKQFLKIKNKL